MSVDTIPAKCSWCGYAAGRHKSNCRNSKHNKQVYSKIKKAEEEGLDSTKDINKERLEHAREVSRQNYENKKKAKEIGKQLLDDIDTKTLTVGGKGVLAIMQVMGYNPVEDLIRTLMDKNGDLSASKRADIDLKLMEFLHPKARESPKEKDEDKGIQVTVNSGVVE